MRPFFLLVIYVAYTSCQSSDGEVSLRSYYFPVQEFMQPQEWVFQNRLDSTEIVVWQMRTHISGGDTLFTTTILDKQNKPTEQLTELIDGTGSKIFGYNFYADSGTVLSNTVLESWVMKWDMRKGDTVRWKIDVPNEDGKLYMDVTKTRKFISIDSSKQVAIFADDVNVVIKSQKIQYSYMVDFYYTYGRGLQRYHLLHENGSEKLFELKAKR
jgi:hypothetical protein